MNIRKFRVLENGSRVQAENFRGVNTTINVYYTAFLAFSEPTSSHVQKWSQIGSLRPHFLADSCLQVLAVASAMTRSLRHRHVPVRRPHGAARILHQLMSMDEFPRSPPLYRAI